jgi:outer membrane protein OmpA-like peptidoglycan-associated protein
MNGRVLLIAGMLGSMAVGLGAARLAAQTGAPSESDIGRALRPAPRGLGEQQGLPTLGPMPPTPESANVHGASLAPGPSRPAMKAQKSRAAAAAATAGSPPRSSIAFDTIQFAYNSAQLTPGSIETLRNLGNALNKELADQKAFVIEGHTDASGGLQYNIVLSRRRADAVKDYLVREAHVAPSRLQTVGKGPSEPVNAADPYAPENRRVVVINLGS